MREGRGGGRGRGSLSHDVLHRCGIFCGHIRVHVHVCGWWVVAAHAIHMYWCVWAPAPEMCLEELCGKCSLIGLH